MDLRGDIYADTVNNSQKMNYPDNTKEILVQTKTGCLKTFSVNLAYQKNFILKNWITSLVLKLFV